MIILLISEFIMINLCFFKMYFPLYISGCWDREVVNIMRWVRDELYNDMSIVKNVPLLVFR